MAKFHTDGDISDAAISALPYLRRWDVIITRFPVDMGDWSAESLRTRIIHLCAISDLLIIIGFGRYIETNKTIAGGRTGRTRLIVSSAPVPV